MRWNTKRSSAPSPQAPSKRTRKPTVFSSKRLRAIARSKITAGHVGFRRLDLREKWSFDDDSFDLVTCSLALEHIENIDFVFAEAHRVLRAGGRFYFGELHPFKQYQGSKARFETGAGVFELECFVHHVAEFFAAGKNNDFEIQDLREWFDDGRGTVKPSNLWRTRQAAAR